jgi:hypothetical protein
VIDLLKKLIKRKKRENLSYQRVMTLAYLQIPKDGYLNVKDLPLKQKENVNNN